MVIYILLAAIFLAYSNGANDNFKGVSTLFGSGTADYRRALVWATVTTFLGSMFAIYISGNLVISFTGKGLVADEVVRAPAFMLAVGLGAALTVYLATVTGFPISTTHAITGALIGGGIASGAGVLMAKLWSGFIAPLLLSPALALMATVLIYPIFRFVRERCGISQETCICVGEREEAVQFTPSGAAILRATGLTLTVDQIENCKTRYGGSVIGIGAQTLLDRMHYLTAGAVGFARGLNDTPKVVALLVAARIMGVRNGLILAGLAIALGGWLNARKVAETMSRKITRMNHGQGFTANMVTAALVIFASQWGMPVSTTHISCGSLFGIGLVNGKADWGVIGKILMSWLITLPAAGIFSAIIYQVAR